MKTRSLVLIFFGLYIGWSGSVEQASQAQQPSATPVRVTIATSTPVSTAQQLATATFTWTPTPLAAPQLEALPEAGEVNVRSLPDPSSQRLGTIRAGELYIVRGRYFSWYLFDFPASPTGTGWVFSQLVRVIGDESAIPTNDPYAAPTSAADAEAQATLAALLGAPGGEATATAASRIIVLPTSTVDAALAVPQALDRRATFTPPAEFNPRVMPTATPEDAQGLAAAISLVNDSGVAPGVPIAILAGVGLMGLVVALLRR
jgi:hypothetical protein